MIVFSHLSKFSLGNSIKFSAWWAERNPSCDQALRVNVGTDKKNSWQHLKIVWVKLQTFTPGLTGSYHKFMHLFTLNILNSNNPSLLFAI